MKQKVSLLVEHEKSLNHQRKLRESIEHVSNHREYQCTDVDGSVILVLCAHTRPQVHRRRDQGHYNDLNGLENVEESVAFYEKQFSVPTDLEEVRFGDRVFVEYERSWM